MVLECLAAAEILEGLGVTAEVIDLRTISPLDAETCIGSVAKTRRVVVADTGHTDFGVTAEVVARISCELGTQLLANPRRVGLPTAPTPTTPALSDHYYPTADTIVDDALMALGIPRPSGVASRPDGLRDVPNRDFKGPY